jgi:FtsP/CotA-like multicopper oxidase with cupredoxin domain
MSRRQRFTFLAIAVAIAVVAVVVLADSSEDDSEPSQTAATATATATEEASPGEETPTPTATPTATPTPKPPPLLTSGKVTELEFTEGETVRFRVRADEAEEVHVHGYDISKDVEPGQTVTMSFKATIPGIFEIELEHAHEQIAELTVETG